MLEHLSERWEDAAYRGGGIERLVALLLPGVSLALAVLAFISMAEGSITAGGLIVAAFGFVVLSWVVWRSSAGRRFDRRAAERLASRDGWNERIEFAGRPAESNFVFRGTIWIATDRRLVEARRPRWWRTHQAAAPLHSIDYDHITGIGSIRTRGGGDGPRFTTVSLTLDSGELKLNFSPSAAKELLGRITAHTGLAGPQRSGRSRRWRAPM